MASVSRDKNGNRTIQFVAGDRKRRSIRLGKMNQKAVDAIKAKVEALNAAAVAGISWDRETADWVAGRDATLYDKLSVVGLVPKRAAADRVTLAAFLDAYVKGRSDVKRSTATVYGHTRRCLVEYFGADKPLGEITLADADEWRRWLTTKHKLADNTVRRRCGIARQFMRAAQRKRLIAENPFADLKGVAVRSNRSRDHFVSREDAAKVLDACPDAEWRLIFALSRYGGLRCPSEHLELRLSDIDWAGGRIKVRSSKTAHHEGKDSRLVPIFPELRPYLEAVWFAAEPGTEYLITRYRESNVNLRSRLLDIIWAAGLKEWPKLFQNLRASRATELAAEFPGHVAAEWLGHSTLVAQKHYWQTTDADFDRAVAKPTGALHKPVQSQAGTAGNEPSANREPLAIPANYEGLYTCTFIQVGDAGLEPATSTL